MAGRASVWRVLPALAALVLGGSADARAQDASYVELQRLSGVLNHIRLNYAEDVGYAELVRGAIEGALESLDPHSSFYARGDWTRLNALERGELATTGMHLEEVDGRIVVRALDREGPAEEAGVLPGDRVVSIDGVTVDGLGAQDVELRLAGDDRSRLVVRLERGPLLDPAAFEVRLRRTMPRERSVGLATMLDDSTGYVALERFHAEAGDELEQSIRDLQRDGARRVVLDLRGNPGGVVTAAGDATALFLRDDDILFRTRGRKSDANQEFVADGNGRFRDLPLVVLVDEGSASAAEALAASLQDHDRALLAGRRTFGKALMQAPFFLQGGDVVWLTVGLVESPSGRTIQRPYRGRRVEEYRAGAGVAETDEAPEFRTDAGRLVLGGGGVRPDVPLPAPADLPVWWAEALQAGHASAIADSTAHAARGAGARPDWLDDAAQRDARLVVPLLARVRSAFGIEATLSDPARGRIGLLLAERAVAAARGAEEAAAYRLAHDGDVIAARALFGQSERLRAAPAAASPEPADRP